MTQTAPVGSGRVSAPFPSPPGLDVPSGAEAAATSSRSPLAAQLGVAPGLEANGANRTEVVEAVRRVLLNDVDCKVTEKVEELWSRGKTMLSQVHQKQQKKADDLSAEITRCLEKQQTLEAENEQLKQVLTGLAARLSILCPGPFGGHGLCSAPSPDASTNAGSSVASASPGTQTSASDLYSPAGGAAGPLTGGDSFSAPLPEVPAFPFPAPSPTSTAAPLLLAEALGTPSAPPQGHVGPMPLSLASSLLPSPLEAPQVFSFTLRKADETDLGLNVSQHDDKVLTVEGVRPDGAVDAWNRQCMGGAFAEKAVRPGDRIISVNSVSYNPEKMLEECKDKQLLRLTLVRGDMPLPEMPLQAASGFGSPTEWRPTMSLRADATEFVPMAAATAAPEAAAESAQAS
mmetsp:Transcript_16398/g.42355  ORF Transcript_16398/g.42355 Transcript_16398/m.42355 type:complete len:402 (-) Transcript_16398:302-1507(-)